MIATERQRILAVDDNEEILDLIRLTLEAEYDVVTISDPVDLYEVLDVFEPDLLILDIMMPRINGFQLIEMLRKSLGTKDLPILVLSAKNSAGEIKHGYKLGATLYLTKPFVPDRLKKNVETQFRVHPTGSRKKSAEGHTLAAQLEMTPSFRKGHLQMSHGIARKDQIIDARKRIEDKIRKDEADAEVAKRGWKG